MNNPLKCPCCGNLALPSAVTDDWIPLKRKGLKKLSKFLTQCTDDVDGIRECDIMLRSLEHYLAEDKSPDPDKALLLLRYWLDISPNLLEATSDRLNAASELMKIILDASK